MPISRRTLVDVDAFGSDLVAAEEDAAGVERLEQVHAAQQRRLARARRADHADHLVLGDREVDPAQHLVPPERLVDVLELDRVHARASSRAAVARDQPVGEARERDRQQQEQQRGREVRRVVEGGGRLDLRLAKRLDDTEQRHERGVLLQPDEVVQQRRNDAADGLRQHDVAHRLRVREPERPRGRRLARMDRLDARAVDLGDVRGVDEHERDRGPEELRVRHAVQLQPRDAEAEQVDEQDRRDAAEDVGVRGGEHPQRKKHRAGEASHDGEEEREDEDEHLGDEEELDVRLERFGDVRERVLEDAPVEELLLDLRPVRAR